MSGERWSWRGGEDGGVVGDGGNGDDGVGGAGGESGADRRSSSSQARIRVVSVVSLDLINESIATVGEIRVWWRANFQSGSRVLKKVF